MIFYVFIILENPLITRVLIDFFHFRQSKKSVNSLKSFKYLIAFTFLVVFPAIGEFSESFMTVWAPLQPIFGSSVV